MIPLQLSVKRRAASSAHRTCRRLSSVVRSVFEVLLSLLFALDDETQWSRRIWVCEGTDGAN
jgi:uncharacterized membrane protein YkvA (DUF1232 family)